MAKKDQRVGKDVSANGARITVMDKLPALADAVALAVFEKTKEVPQSLTMVDAAVGGALGRVIALGDFKGKAGGMAIVPVNGRIKRLIVVGLGKREKFDLDNVRWMAGNVARVARDLNLGLVVLQMPGDISGEAKSEAVAQATAEGLVLGGFVYDEFKKPKDNGEPKPVRAAHFAILESDRKQHAAVKQGIHMGTVLANGANYARRIASKPGNVINPTTLAAEARNLARRVGLKIRVIGAAEATRLGMGGLVAVGQGSVEQAALILLEHKPARAKGKPVAVVGKAVTFDTGGISIKPAADMDAMKYDKCGGMAVLGIMQAVAQMRLPVGVIGVIPTAENSVSAAAYRPGDILRMFNGKTVEITNTDAEGRLILADALAYVAKTYEPAAIIDMATLTGGVVVALGSVYAGLMANDDGIAHALERAGVATGELVWRLPLHERYKPIMDGTHADLQNSGGREAQTITACIFLQHFVPESTPWAHLDIAAMAHPKKDDRYTAKGASGFGVRLVMEYLRGR